MIKTCQRRGVVTADLKHGALGKQEVEIWNGRSQSVAARSAAPKNSMDYLIPWEIQSYPSFSGCDWNSSLTEKIRGSFVDEPRDALKTRVDSFGQWEFQPDPSFCGYV